MDNLTEYYSSFEVVGIKKANGSACSVICREQAGECKNCPLQEAINKLYKIEYGKEAPGYEK